jgi:periplasmic protein CpxP/Spy
MNILRSSRRPARAFRLFTLTALVGLAGAVLQTAQAAPGGHGAMGAHGDMAAMGHRGEMGHMGPMEHMGRMNPMGRLLDRVGASAEQKAQIKTLMDAARKDVMPLHAQMKSLREQSAALFTQPAVDANAAEALRQQMHALQGQAGKRMLQAMVESSRVLTPEQRAKMADMIGKRRAMAERHRAEADALMGQPAGSK